MFGTLDLFVSKDNMNMNVNSGACGNRGDDDDDDDEDGEAADMEGTRYCFVFALFFVLCCTVMSAMSRTLSYVVWNSVFLHSHLNFNILPHLMARATTTVVSAIK